MFSTDRPISRIRVPVLVPVRCDHWALLGSGMMFGCQAIIADYRCVLGARPGHECGIARPARNPQMSAQAFAL